MPQPCGLDLSGSAIGRRRLLIKAAGLVAAVPLASCTAGTPGSTGGTGSTAPSSSGSGTRSGASAPASPSPTPIAQAKTAISTETRLCALTLGVLAKTGDDAATGRLRSTLGQLRDAHLDHLRSLSADPRQPSHPASPALPRAASVASDLDDAVDQLVSAEKAAARRHRSQLSAAGPDVALVWASLAAAAGSYADALEAKGVSGSALGLRRQLEPAMTQPAALSSLLAQVHAGLYGYQVAVPRLGSDDATAATGRITSLYQLRDQLTQQLVGLRATPPAAAPVYTLTPRPTSASTANRLLAGIETRLQPFLGAWVSVSTGSERTRAADALSTAARAAIRWGGAVNRWPGWA